MKIDIDDYTRDIINTIIFCVSLITVLYFIIVIWWAGFMEVQHKEELKRHETCFQEYRFNEAYQRYYLYKNYCGEAGKP